MKSYLLLIVLLYAVSCSKLPQCTCEPLIKQTQSYPILANQTQIYDIDKLFNGFNLSFSIVQGNDIAKLKQKIIKVQQIKTQNSGFQHYHFAHNEHAWGKSLITLSVVGNKTIVRWGTSKKDGTLPSLSNEVTITNDSSFTCFDAVWFETQMVILIDCTQYKNNKLQNVFFYLNSTSKIVLQKTTNSLYVPFKTIQHRKIDLLSKNGQNYLIRAYLADKVNKQFENNTYVQFMSVTNPLKPYTIGLIDRSAIRQSKFSVMDISVYLDSIYILDYHSGVVKIDIQSNNGVTISGKYQTDVGFNKLGVYFDNLNNQYYFALANSQLIVEARWESSSQHQMIAKYYLPNKSQLLALWLNKQYIITQLAANLTNNNDKTSTYQSTYIFTKQTTSYLSPYLVITHQDTPNFIDFNQEASQILIINSTGLVIYQIAHPQLIVNPINPPNNSYYFKVIGRSYGYANYATCFVQLQFKIYESYSPEFIWPLQDIPTIYYANNKGIASIPLNRYALAPNLTFKISTSSKQLPANKIYYQNSTKITWNNKYYYPFKFQTFVQKQYDSLKDGEFYLYLQNEDNLTEFDKCSTVQSGEQIKCSVEYMPHMNYKMAILTASKFDYRGKNYHLAAIRYQILNNQVFIYDVQDQGQLFFFPLIYPQTIEKTVTSVEFIGKYLAVAFQYTKEVYIYDMQKCIDNTDHSCSQSYIINKKIITELGVDYFTPVKIYSSSFHANTLFLQCLDRIIILGITKDTPILLAELKFGQQFTLNKRLIIIGKSKMVLVNPPNLIKQYDLSYLGQSKTLAFVKKYPTFGYLIPDKFSSAFSDKNSLFYITAINPSLPQKSNKVILIYKANVPALASFYHAYSIKQDCKDVQIGVSGAIADYVTLVCGTKIISFRQYENPTLQISNVSNDFSFHLSYTNDPSQLKWQSIQLQLKKATSNLRKKQIKMLQIQQQEVDSQLNIITFI